MIDSRGADGFTPLAWAAQNGHTVLAEALLARGADPISQGVDGLTPLHQAIRYKNAAVVKLLLKAGVDPLLQIGPDLRYKDSYYRYMEYTEEEVEAHRHTALAYAFEMDNNEVDDFENVKALLETGKVDVDCYKSGSRNEYDNITVETVECLQVLIDGGADVNATMDDESYNDPNAKTKTSDTPLHLTNPPKLGLLEILVRHGADINAPNATGRSPLLEFLYQLQLGYFLDKFQPDVNVSERLLELGADVDIAEDEGDTIFHYIMSSIDSFTDLRLIPFIRKLLDAGADPNKRNIMGEPPLWKYLRLGSNRDVADINADEVFLRTLIDAGMDLNARDNEGHTILWKLGKRHSVRIRDIEKLVRLGADPRALAPDGRTLLHLAVDRSRSPELFRYLISAGTRTDVLAQDGDTLIHAVLRGAHHDGATQEVLQELVEAGVPPLARNAKSQSVLHVASDNNKLRMVLNMSVFKDLDINEPDVDGLTPLHHMMHVNLLGDGYAPLHYACRAGSPEAVWTLLYNGADARLRDEKGLTPLHTLSIVETPPAFLSAELIPPRGEIVRMLQLVGADVNVEAMIQTTDETTSKTVTPLDVAVERQCWEVARRLISNRFVMETDKKRASEEARKVQDKALEGQACSDQRQSWNRRWRGRWAACTGTNTPVEKGTHFIASGQDILNIKAKDAQHDDNDDNNVCVVNILHGVLRDGDYDTIKEYAELGGDMLERDRYTGNGILHYIVKEGHLELLEHFGDRVTELETQEWVRYDEGSSGTLLSTACQRKEPSLHLIKLLVEKIGVDVNAIHSCYSYYWTELRDSTALHILAVGALFWLIEALDYLLSKGVNIEAKNKDGMTLLLVAIDRQRYHVPWLEETLRVLLRHGANVNATAKGTTNFETERTGLSALELSDQPAITKLLLELGPRVESCPGILTSVIREWMEPELVRLLLNADTDPNKLPFVEKQREDDVQSDGASENVEEADADTDEDLCYPLHQAAQPLLREDETGEQKSRQQTIINLLVSRGADAYASYPDGRFVFQAIVEERGDIRNLLPGGGPSFFQPAIRLFPIVPLELYVVDRICTFPGQFDEVYREAFAALTRHGPAAITKTDKDGRTPLHLALVTYSSGAQQFPFVIKHLLSASADPANPDPVTGNLALHFIAPRLVVSFSQKREVKTVHTSRSIG
ncbi:ankyrin repeat-containing domain protein [Corynascus similis CBS 632.67]